MAIRSDGHGLGDDPYYINQMVAWMKNGANDVTYESYFDANSGGVNSLITGGSFPNSLAAFSADLGDARRRRWRTFPRPRTMAGSASTAHAAPVSSRRADRAPTRHRVAQQRHNPAFTPDAQIVRIGRLPRTSVRVIVRLERKGKPPVRVGRKATGLA